jgi:hypothetical protein
MSFLRHAFLASALLASLPLLLGAPPAAADTVMMKVSTAQSARDYRMDAARHIYAAYPERIYKGKLPPLVHAIVVLEVELDAAGQLRRIDLIRVPKHAPDVVDAVTKLIQRASPMPAPMRLGGARFTEIWLVDKSGRFQLDALTEGQY